MSDIRRNFQVVAAVVTVILALLCSSQAQTTVSTGGIVGNVTDPTGASVPGAKVTITNVGTGQQSDLTTNSSGEFGSGALAPGSYKVLVVSKGFSSSQQQIEVLVGNTAHANLKLEIGQENQVVEVSGSALQVNTEQAEVQGVITAEQIENLPINGRNFLDLAQLEPGVQIQDGQNFDPTKAGYSSISFGGRFGRTARIDVDGVDISDETVGTTTQDIPASAIAEFQIGQSSLDLSNDLTSSGAVNVTTKSGQNSLHGEGFGFIRDHSFAAHAPGGHDYPYQREQFGGNVGGAAIKDKLFFFADGERTKQDSFAAVQLNATPFAAISGGFTQPFRETELLARVDYNLPKGGKAFYRYTYFANSLFATFGFGYSVYDNKDYARQHLVGIDFSSGSLSHSIRYSYLKFQNQIVDATSKNNALPFCCTGLTLASTAIGFSVGPNLLAPQGTPQQDNEIKYDGSKIVGAHTLRYGVSFNHIQGGGFADFYGLAPRVSWSTNAKNTAFAAGGPFAGGAGNPLNWPVQSLRVGNGQGFNTLEPALGFPAGGLGPDNRVGLYVGDIWKIKSNITLTLGIRYDRDTGRTDSDLPAIPEINAAFPGEGNPVAQANLNFAPQLGIAWDPTKSGKTVIRAGAGLFFENVIYNNVLFDRPLRLRTGAFNQVSLACASGQPQPVPVAGGNTISPVGICGNNVAVGTVIPQIQAFWQQVLAGNPFDLKAPNPNFIGNFINSGLGSNGGVALFDPNYKSPRSLQLNVGIQHEIRHGMVFSADYLRNVETRTLVGIDANKVGDVSTFNLAGAQAAIAATNASFGCATVDCSILAGASMSDYAGNGLGTPGDATGAGCTSSNGIGSPCAFGGVNPTQAQMFFLKPEGRSEYNALQMTLKQNVAKPLPYLKALNFQISYSLSRFSNSGGVQATAQPGDNDQDFVIQAADNNNPGRYFGPSLLDRTHQLSFGGYVDIPAGFRFGFVSHFYSPLASSVVAPNSGAPGEIFRTDFTGDGTVQDPLPGTKFGTFGRSVTASGINNLINKYNATTANNPTPAGQVLIANNLMTLAQLQALGGVAPTLPLAPPGQVDFGWLRATDLRLSWSHTFVERFTIEPSVGFYNAFNFSNFNLPPTLMNGLLNGPGSGSINGTTRADEESFRVGNGTGVYSLGSQRQLEFGLRFTF